MALLVRSRRFGDQFVVCLVILNKRLANALGLPFRPCGSPRSSPVWPGLTSLSPGWRRAVLTSQWPWVSGRAAPSRRRAGSPARIATAVYVGVQWGGLGLARLRVNRRQRRVL